MSQRSQSTREPRLTGKTTRTQLLGRGVGVGAGRAGGLGVIIQGPFRGHFKPPLTHLQATSSHSECWSRKCQKGGYRLFCRPQQGSWILSPQGAVAEKRCHYARKCPDCFGNGVPQRTQWASHHSWRDGATFSEPPKGPSKNLGVPGTPGRCPEDVSSVYVPFSLLSEPPFMANFL